MIHKVLRGIMTSTSLREMRKPYKAIWDVLREDKLPKREPVALFDHWFTEAKDSGHTFETNAVAVASATPEGIPSVRMVLLKGFNEDGFVFFTNYDSRKGRELLANPKAAMLFYWDQQHRQVRIEGKVGKISREESEKYFHTRPRGSRISALLSKQSTVVESRKVLDDEHAALTEKYADESKEIPCPENWGGLILVPEKFEFWQGQTSRLHDRLIFRRPSSKVEEDSSEFGWFLERLAP
ncbi:pyridoxine/pyridoxamine 5'-phosphate oxidase [Galendromus occidentalis]|uniref:pyridoxal 5'-phosphate synthase n=1 Tax=Galendromus occidentalis TaxID=34638 RepID=A0AAJ6VYQ2_9ACAR|nr:pyridoxine/pyridoxamine 5'-phosphate oxidase [Galendromus occidentalis]